MKPAERGQGKVSGVPPAAAHDSSDRLEPLEDTIDIGFGSAEFTREQPRCPRPSRRKQPRDRRISLPSEGRDRRALALLQRIAGRHQDR
jgi:hypothetical protein